MEGQGRGKGDLVYDYTPAVCSFKIFGSLISCLLDRPPPKKKMKTSESSGRGKQVKDIPPKKRLVCWLSACIGYYGKVDAEAPPH